MQLSIKIGFKVRGKISKIPPLHSQCFYPSAASNTRNNEQQKDCHKLCLHFKKLWVFFGGKYNDNIFLNLFAFCEIPSEQINPTMDN